ncbi:alcohol oxidase [Coprinellus micaceus]|uniref:pyranose dehydrogenase (acceptor) n=1 Tax=Coprinellus micaceus TaxID=71717 RepID=A0A4Y7T1Z6_COPMI|nr:alcohol oxidase [Coprinellus micaceus]
MVPGGKPGGNNLTGLLWTYMSEPTSGLNGRSVMVPRGHVLGGSSSINGMVYTRGSSDDYDKWAELSGDRRWSWKALWPYILRHERWGPPVGGRNATGEYDPKVHGYSGKVSTSLPWDGPVEHDLRTVKNAELQKEFPITLDVNAGRPMGVSWMQSTIGNGERSSASTAYLTPEVRERPNLTILVNTYITRVLPVRTTGHVPDIRTVEVAPRTGGETRTLTASRELILTAGVIGTPQIFLNSGIGNKTELSALAIPCVLDIPDVGMGLTEHTAANLAWTITPRPTNPIAQDVAWAMWTANRTGPYSAAFTHQMLWARLPVNSQALKDFGDPSAGPRSPHLEMPLDSARSAYLVLLTPYSRGSVKIRSKDPFDGLVIDLNVFSHPFDIAAIKEGIRLAKRFYSGAAWDGYISSFNGPDPDSLSEAEFRTRVTQNALTFYHPVGTAKMSPKNAKHGVVDPELRLKGASGLRIIDSSVFPHIPTAHTQAPVYILAERGVDFIRDSWH